MLYPLKLWGVASASQNVLVASQVDLSSLRDSEKISGVSNGNSLITASKTGALFSTVLAYPQTLVVSCCRFVFFY